jgi:hypothetical protein
MSLFTRNALIALLITVAIIGTVIYAINYLDRKRAAEVDAIESQLMTDTLSIETQFALVANAPCSDIEDGTTLSGEISDLGDRLSLTEERLGSKDPQVVRLKAQYTLLEIRDYLLAKQIASECKTTPPVIALYFYSNAGDCTDCDRAGYALSYLRQTYPALRVYSFDYHLDLGALKTLETVEKVRAEFPAFVIGDKASYGFTSVDDLKALFPKSLFATSTATSTKAR